MQGKTVLVVDDDTSSLELIDFILTLKHYKAELSSIPEDTVNTAVRLKPDLIILDLLMPTMSGIEVCTRLKQDDRTRDIPVLFISAMVSERDMEAGVRAGAVGYIIKPYDTSQVLAKIDQIMSKMETLK